MRELSAQLNAIVCSWSHCGLPRSVISRATMAVEIKVKRAGNAHVPGQQRSGDFLRFRIFSLGVDIADFLAVPDVAKVLSLPTRRKKIWPKDGEAFSARIANTVIGNAI